MVLVTSLTRLARRVIDVALVGLIAFVVATVLLARVIPAVTGGTTLVVAGGSMDPAVPLGAAVLATPVRPQDLAVGDVVSVQVGEQHAVFTHRIVRLVPRDGGLWLETKGDSNRDPDPSIIPAADVIGRASLTVPYAGYAIRMLSAVEGVAFLLSLGVCLLAGAWLLESLEEDMREAGHRKGLGAEGTAGSELPAEQGAAG
jgi:signal peptidase I